MTGHDMNCKSALQGRRLLLGVTGGIAAYKSAVLARALIRAGAEVRVVMTSGAKAFIQPLTFQALTGHPTHEQLLDPEAEAGMGHIELARWAETVLIAPATADVMAKLAAGLADDLLTTLCLATQADIWIAPAMNQAMWAHPATQRNQATLATLGYRLIQPEAGLQACGDTGAGRMPEPETLVTHLQHHYAQARPEDVREHPAALATNPQQSIASAPQSTDPKSTAPQSTSAQSTSAPEPMTEEAKRLRITITAGPTREPLDPVRYLSNHSSGKMGFALAEAAARQGADVTLITGPVDLPTPDGVTRLNVETAEQMLDAVLKVLPATHMLIGCAAVADYRAATVAEHKIKKQAQNGDELTLHLVKNPDIIATAAARGQANFVVGFAAETRDVEAYAEDKLIRKQLNAIVANDVSDPTIGFGSDDNRVTLLSRQGENIMRQPLPQASKTALSDTLIRQLIALYDQHHPS